jgi:alkylation response protein AidB-like acyl-CoA dehydrogenase
MELDLSSDQELLRDTAAKFIEAKCPLIAGRRLADSPTGVDPGYLTAAGELGWFAMLVPEADGGGSISGEGLRDLAIVAEERGRVVQPGPFVPMNVVAHALSVAGSVDHRSTVLPEVVSATTVATWVAGDAGGAWSPGSTVAAFRQGDGFRLQGHAGLVQDGGWADWLLVSAGGPDGLSQFLVPAATPGITVASRVGHDLTQRFASVAFDGVDVPAGALVGAAGGAAAQVERQFQIALVLSMAETIGAADVLFEMARAYAADRTAFGRPIGSFQAIKHLLADLSLSLEAGKAAVTAATRAVQAEADDAAEVASIAKTWLGDIGIDIAQGCFQVFGGIGYTWEHDSHLFLRRITMNGLLYGQADWHRERICALQGLSKATV